MANALEFVYENVDPMSLKRFHQMAYETTPKLLSSETYEHLMVRDPAVVDIHCILKEGERLLRRKHNAASTKSVFSFCYSAQEIFLDRESEGSKYNCITGHSNLFQSGTSYRETTSWSIR